ncbi:MAG: hypothetical protein BWY14_00568 [Parcubacteria group bacterium ADurb.Bin192]|nr:MAG: hypothetical protein BWY14_00568 [Parcubacteria group bacterium ADurb.Bin192]
MSYYQLLKKIRKIKAIVQRSKPDPVWLLSTRSTLLMQVKNTLPVEAPRKKEVAGELYKFVSPFFNFSKMIRKPVFAGLAVIVTLFGGSLFSVSAAEQSLPGDFLYSVKLATEQARLAMAKDSKDKVKLKTEFTERRVDEMKKVIAAPDANKKEKVIQTAEVLKRDMDTIKQQLGDMQGKAGAQDIKDTAKMIDQKTSAVVQALQDSKLEMSPEEKAKITEAQEAASSASVKAIEILADTHKTDGDVVSQQDVADVLKTHGEMVSKTMSQSFGSMPAIDAASSTTLGSASGTAMTTTTSSNLQKVTEAQKSLSEVDQLADENKMDEAIAKLKVGTQQAFDAQKTLEQQAPTTGTAVINEPALPSASSTEPVQNTTTTPDASTSTLESSEVDTGQGG